MSTQKLTKRQSDALKDVKKWNGRFSIFWRPKSWPVLVELGLAELDGAVRVKITKEGIEWLEANQ